MGHHGQPFSGYKQEYSLKAMVDPTTSDYTR